MAAEQNELATKLYGKVSFSLAALVVLGAVLTYWLRRSQPGSQMLEAASRGPGHIQVKEGFEVELVYPVPREERGSWVALAVDPKGRLISSDQSGLLYRITPPPIGEDGPVEVEPIEVWLKDAEGERVGDPIGGAQGLLHAFGALYVVVNSSHVARGSGLYRLRDTNGDDQYDQVELLKRFQGTGEHGPHSVRFGPDGESLYIVAGNATAPPENADSRLPKNWATDTLFQPLPDPRGIGTGLEPPAGWIARTDPNGTTFEIISAGLRNAYDFDFNHEGDIFVYDSDAEGDIGLPWYRPIRVNHVTSGSELGWRTGSGKWPDYYQDTLPPFLELGEGSPTGVTFGYGAEFPARYQHALFLCDWAYGELDLAHLEPYGATYRARSSEPFLAGTPLPLTALSVNPNDGANYFVTGGRGAQSALYRITYTGDESTEPVDPPTIAEQNSDAAAAHELRRALEAFHGVEDGKAIEKAWPELNHRDRFIRYAARIAIEHQPAEQWARKALNESEPIALVEALIALARQGDDQFQPEIVERLNGVDYAALPQAHRLAWLRAYELVFIRLGEPDDETRREAIEALDPLFPADTASENRLLSQLLIFLDAPGIVSRILGRLEAAPTAEEQIQYARALIEAESGWDTGLYERYFEWLHTMSQVSGGKSFRGYIESLYDRGKALLTDKQAEKLAALLDREKIEPKMPEVEPRDFHKNWAVEEIVEAVTHPPLQAQDYSRGREMFAATRCFDCHRMGREGGTFGPDLTGISRRFSVEDLAEKLVDPNLNVSDQYANTVFELEDGRRISGRISDIFADRLLVVTNPYAPSDYTEIDRNEIVNQKRSDLSIMPPGLLNTLNEEELRDLFAFLLGDGDSDHPYFENQK